MLRGAEIFLQCLRAEGVDLVFGYPGGAIMPLYDALEGSGIRHILTRHEQGAVFAAEGHARATGKVGVAIATSGPGATNLVTGIADAKMDSVPLVCITGQVRSALIGTDAFQETDVFGLTLSLTKWSRLVKSIEEIPSAIAEGFYWAREGRPGPVVIDIPTDFLKGKMEFAGPVKFSPKPRPSDAQADATVSDKLIALLQKAERPVALIGAGAKLSGAIQPLRDLLDELNIPAFATVHGLGAVPPDAPYYLGMVGMHGTRAANMALHENDLLLIFGARLDDRVTGDPSRFAPNAKIVHFEIDPAQLDRVRQCELPVVGDLANTIPAFHKKLRGAKLPDWNAWRAVAVVTNGVAIMTFGGQVELFFHFPLEFDALQNPRGCGTLPFLWPAAGRQRRNRGRRAAPDVVGPALPVGFPAWLYYFGRAGIDGICASCCSRSAAIEAQYDCALRLRRRRISDEHSGAGHGAPPESADQDGDCGQQISGHGPAVAAAFLSAQLCGNRSKR